jgi:hydroxymethylbilane synthase
MLPDKLVIASRASRLAMWQSEHVQQQLQQRYPGLRVEIRAMSTAGDRILDRSLSKIGGKGLFVKELEAALQEGAADLAVHSCKDVPMTLPAGFALAAILQREDARDCLVAPVGQGTAPSSGLSSLATLPPGARIGTSSLRREVQLRARYPQLQILPVRGNLDTRLGKLDRGEFDAIVLAAAGLMRLGLGHRISRLLTVEDSLPAAGQGALAIEICDHRDDLRALLAPLQDPHTAACVSAERTLARALGGSCQVPLAAYACAALASDSPACASSPIRLRALVADLSGQQVVRAEAEADPAQAEQLGLQVAERMREGGVEALLAAFQ